MRFAKASLVVLLLASPVAAASSEGASIPRSRETIDVSIVNLDVIVTDRKGNHVPGLTASDFEVFEDGAPQAISNFAEYASAPKATVASSKAGVSMPPADAPQRERRTIAIFIEDFHLPGFRVATIFDALKKTLHEVVAPGDAVLIATWKLRTKVILDYTDNLASIDAVLDRVAKESASVQYDTIDNHLKRLQEIREFFGEIQDFGAKAGLKVDDRSKDAALQSEANDQAVMEKMRIRAKAAAINALITSMSNDNGRKALILMTRRFSELAGGEYFYAIDPGPDLDPSKRSEHMSYSLFESIKATANAHGVTIYALYPPGLDSVSFTMPTQAPIHGGDLPPLKREAFNHQVLDNELATLNDITKATGGTTSWGSVYISEALPRIRDDFNAYYSLAYRVPVRKDNRARNITVKAKNGDYTVRSRRQYMEKTDDGRVRDQVIATLFRSPVLSGIKVEMSVGQAEAKEGYLFSIPVSLRMPVASFMTKPEGAVSKGSYTVYIATGRIAGETSDITKQTIPFTVGDSETVPEDGYFTFNFELVTDFTTDRLAVGVFDEVSRDSGFARFEFYSPKP